MTTTKQKKAPSRKDASSPIRTPRGKGEARTKPTMSKSDFVKSMPPEMHRREVVAKAAQQGLNITEKYVTNIRYNQRASGDRGKAAATQTPPAATNGDRKKSGGNGTPNHVAAFTEAVFALGVEQSQQLLDQIRNRIRLTKERFVAEVQGAIRIGH